MSARKQTGASQQNPSGTVVIAPQQKSGCTAAIETRRPRHAKSLGKVGGVHVRPLKRRQADTANAALPERGSSGHAPARHKIQR